MPYLTCTVCNEDLPYPNAGHCHAHNQICHVACANCNKSLKNTGCWILTLNGTDYYLCNSCYKQCADWVPNL